eukprot:m.287338 g.287338  ORF g.287338 m.287338 type:complete len:296 (+) comp22929_c1_seq10:1410-2297(+)
MYNEKGCFMFLFAAPGTTLFGTKPTRFPSIITGVGSVVFVCGGERESSRLYFSAAATNRILRTGNACNAPLMAQAVVEDMRKARKEIVDCADDMEDWHDHCHVLLKATGSMAYADFARFLCMGLVGDVQLLQNAHPEHSVLGHAAVQALLTLLCGLGKTGDLAPQQQSAWKAGCKVWTSDFVTRFFWHSLRQFLEAARQLLGDWHTGAAQPAELHQASPMAGGLGSVCLCMLAPGPADVAKALAAGDGKMLRRHVREQWAQSVQASPASRKFWCVALAAAAVHVSSLVTLGAGEC